MSAESTRSTESTVQTHPHSERGVDAVPERVTYEVTHRQPVKQKALPVEFRRARIRNTWVACILLTVAHTLFTQLIVFYIVSANVSDMFVFIGIYVANATVCFADIIFLIERTKKYTRISAGLNLFFVTLTGFTVFGLTHWNVYPEEHDIVRMIFVSMCFAAAVGAAQTVFYVFRFIKEPPETTLNPIINGATQSNQQPHTPAKSPEPMSDANSMRSKLDGRAVSPMIRISPVDGAAKKKKRKVERPREPYSSHSTRPMQYMWEC